MPPENSPEANDWGNSIRIFAYSKTIWTLIPRESDIALS